MLKLLIVAVVTLLTIASCVGLTTERSTTQFFCTVEDQQTGNCSLPDYTAAYAKSSYPTGAVVVECTQIVCEAIIDLPGGILVIIQCIEQEDGTIVCTIDADRGPQTSSTQQQICALDQDGNWIGDCGPGPSGGGGGDNPQCVGVCDPNWYGSDGLCSYQCGRPAQCVRDYRCDSCPESYIGHCF